MTAPDISCTPSFISCFHEFKVSAPRQAVSLAFNPGHVARSFGGDFSESLKYWDVFLSLLGERMNFAPGCNKTLGELKGGATAEGSWTADGCNKTLGELKDYCDVLTQELGEPLQ